jgi:hypothetical protein
VSANGQLGDDDLSERAGFNLSIASYRGAQGARHTSLRNLSVSTTMTPAADTLRLALAVRTGGGEVALAVSRCGSWPARRVARRLRKA